MCFVMFLHCKYEITDAEKLGDIVAKTLIWKLDVRISLRSLTFRNIVGAVEKILTSRKKKRISQRRQAHILFPN
jgi:hypothetical protein